MRPDVDPKALTPGLATCLQKFNHPNAFGGIVKAADYDGFREDEGKRRLFIATRSGDPSYEWLDVSDYKQYFSFEPKPGRVEAR